MAKIVLKDNFKVMFLSGHSKEATIDVHYNKSTDEQTKEYANEVAEKVFNLPSSSPVPGPSCLNCEQKKKVEYLITLETLGFICSSCWL